MTSPTSIKSIYPKKAMMEIPFEQLSQEAFVGAIEEFVLRENAESGHSESSLELKVAEVVKLLKTKRAKLVFDPITMTHSVVNFTDESTNN